MNKINSRILLAVLGYTLITIISFSVGWWIIGLALIAGGGFILYRISGSSVGITQLDFLKKIPGNKSWWTYGLVALSTLYYVLLGFGVIKWEWVQFNVLIMLLIITLSAVLAGSKDISSSLQGVMKLWTVLSIAGIIALMLATRFAPGLIQSLDYSNSSVPPPTEQSAEQQEQVQGQSPTPSSSWDSTQFSDRGGIVLDKPSQEISIPPDSELCMSELIDPDTGGNLLQRVTVGTYEYNTRMSNCWDLVPRNVSILVGHPDGAEVGNEYKKFGGKLPVIRKK
jgi:hypothetical protein